MVWEWLNPRLSLQDKNAKEKADSECLSPALPGLSSPRRVSSAGLLSDSLEVVSATTSNVPAAAAVVHFVEHEVQRGDCLFDIGRRHNVDLRSLLKANPKLGNPDSLRTGSKIKVPCPPPGNRCLPSAKAPATVTGNCEASVSALKPVPISSQPETLSLSKVLLVLGGMILRSSQHKVVDGDTLEWLAEKYDTSVSTLKKLNNLQGHAIYAGSILKINRPQTVLKQQSLLGRKLTARERSALMEGVLIHAPQLVREPTMANPSFKTYPLLQRDRNLTPPPRLKTVRVQFGDTLADIAYEHGLSIRELQRLNNLRNDVIFEGDVLVVSTGPLERGFLDVRPGQRRTNRLLFSRASDSGVRPSVVRSPISTLKARGNWERKKGFQHQQDGWLRFSSPLIDGFVSSPFGWRWGAFHEGVDLAADQGTPIFASDRGTVSFAGWSGGYGYLVAIQHEGGFVTRYAHCCAIHSRVGQQVMKGQQVAAVGATGHATGPHLHFEVRRNGEALDPFKWVNL